MSDSFYLPIGQRIQSARGDWYRNLQRLGQGGNAITFLAVATSGAYRGIPFAVKLFRKLSRPERRESLLRETAFLFTCDHPSVMRVFDSGVVHSNKKSYPFLVAEYLPDTLDNVIDAGDIGIVEKVSFAMQLLSALAYLHSLAPPVIHRDIKPQNIFVKGKSCVLGDLGLMKQVGASTHQDSEEFKEGIGAGMPRNYRTPDQVAYLKREQPCLSHQSLNRRSRAGSDGSVEGILELQIEGHAEQSQQGGGQVGGRDRQVRGVAGDSVGRAVDAAAANAATG